MFIDEKPLEFVYHKLFLGSRADLSRNTRASRTLRKYYSQFPIKLISYKTLKSHPLIHKEEFNYAWTEYQQAIIHFKRKNLEMTDNSFLKSPTEGSARHFYRWIIKMQWLINDIQSKGLKEPITAMAFPDIKNQDRNEKFSLTYHPGTFRLKAFELLDIDPLIVFFDMYNLFPNHKCVETLEEILDLYQDDEENFEFAVLPNNDNFQTPQIVNQHVSSLNSNMTKNLTKFEETVRSQWDKPINIFIGYDSRHTDASNVCQNSIGQTAIHEIRKEWNIHIHHLDISKIDEYTRPYANQSTEFTYSRFLAPYLSNYEGWSIFVDDDFIFTKNPLNLLFYINNDKAVSVVKHDFSHKHNTKFKDTKDVWYPKKLWSSLMVFNNEHPDCKKLTPDVINTASGQYLHQFEWTSEDKIGSIPNKWNWCEGYDDINNIHDSWGLHWTRGGPWVEDMVNYNHIEGLEVYDMYRTQPVLKDYRARRATCFVKLRDFYEVDSAVKDKLDNSKKCFPKEG